MQFGGRGTRRIRTSGKETGQRLRPIRIAFLVVGVLAANLIIFLPSGEMASGHPPTDPLHGGQGAGVEVIGHNDLRTMANGQPVPGLVGLNGHVAVLGNHAYVGFGTNGGHMRHVCGHFNTGIECGARGAQWNTTPKCRDAPSPLPSGTVKVVSLEDPRQPRVVATIEAGPWKTVARDVSVLRANTPLFRGDLLAVALESCHRIGQGGELAPVTGDPDRGAVGVKFYDITNPAVPVLLSFHDLTAASVTSPAGIIGTREVSLVQRSEDGRVFALVAVQGRSLPPGVTAGAEGGIDILDLTNPRTPLRVGNYEVPTNWTDPAFTDQPLQSSADNCRPWKIAQGVKANANGSKAYVAYQDAGALVVDIKQPELGIPLLGQTSYADGFSLSPTPQEGNTFRFAPNSQETLALATDEDLNPARSTVTLTTSDPTTGLQTTFPPFPACEGIWGQPLYKESVPSVSGDLVLQAGLPGQGCVPSFDSGGFTDWVALVQHHQDGGLLPCTPAMQAKLAQDAGAKALLINIGDANSASNDRVVFSPDSERSSNDITIPVYYVPKKVKDEWEQTAVGQVVIEDKPGQWGGLRIFDISKLPPEQTSLFNTAHSNDLPGQIEPTAGMNWDPKQGDYHAVNAVWAEDKALVAWMSDGFRLVDASNPNSPLETAYYVPPAVSDPTGNYPEVPLVVDVERFGSYVVITDINSGLYVLKVNDLVPQLNLSVTDVTVTEADNEPVMAAFNVSVNPPLDVPVRIDYKATGDSAKPDTDFVPTSGSLTLASNQGTTSFSVPVIGDTVPEPTEQFFADVTASIDAATVTARGVGTILDTDKLIVPPADPDPNPGVSTDNTGADTTIQTPPQQTVQQTAQQANQATGQAQPAAQPQGQPQPQVQPQPPPQAQPQGQLQAQSQLQSQVQVQNEAAIQAQPAMMMDKERQAQTEGAYSNSRSKTGDFLASARAPSPPDISIGVASVLALMMSVFLLARPRKTPVKVLELCRQTQSTVPMGRPRPSRRRL